MNVSPDVQENFFEPVKIHYTADHNSSFGFFAESSDGNTFDHNDATGNTDGFFVVFGDENVFDHNVAKGNIWTGFGAWNANFNTWTKNTADSNGHYGFALYGDDGVYCTNNTLSKNAGQSNGEFDAYDQNPPGSNNTWTNNTFGATSGL